MEINQNLPLLLDRKDVVLVKPSSPTPSAVLSLSTIDNDFNLELLCQTIYVYKARTDFPSGHNHEPISDPREHSDPACAIKEALSRVLVYYYPLGGKLKRHNDGLLRISCDITGVPFLEATANCSLSSLNYLDGIEVEKAKLFVFDLPDKDADGYHPLLLQVTKFSCGGFTIGMGLSHSVCDGFGAAQFFRVMAELASGKSEPSVKPVWERERLVGKSSQVPIQFPADKASLATSPYWPTTDLVHESFNVKSESIRKLKKCLMKEAVSTDESFSFTLIEALGAYIWRSRLRALELKPDGKTLFSLAVGIRNLINPPLPDGYYGNAFLSTQVVLTGKELEDGPLSKVAKLIKESKEIASSTEFIPNSLSFLETLRELNIKIERSGACTVLTDWRRLNLLEEVDFGWKAAVNVIPVPGNIIGFVDLCIILPPSGMDASMKGGVRILVCLPRTATARFKEEMKTLEQLGDDYVLI